MHNFIVDIRSLCLVSRSVLATNGNLTWFMDVDRVNFLDSARQFGVTIQTSLLSEGNRVVRKSRHAATSLLSDLVDKEHALLRAACDHPRRVLDGAGFQLMVERGNMSLRLIGISLLEMR